ncbi:GNAT family N-acetyltransferase [Salmonella enterica]|uniref:GNAT family N-acetyltransferase n=1 Tax=Salmonella enterica TaxID=28901 RepID=UPI0012F0FED7|nr:GNAT family N-acetyltransferase [Salmonella enterica]ECW0267672.1 GNAT family N-acetyltransferase [Salmonella enterica subsp. diarizonae]EBD5984829.1 GNAT family N-acetyltransferase [Salmonella enterica]EBI4324831.1 GNAT family N-acetyltransferase [Salmonella enterica]ECO4385997.1 GNAT family N-acetyltransferase [Salmonella enterica]
MQFKINQATLHDASHINSLFISYRQFYDKSSDPAQTLYYLQERLRNGESVIFYAEDLHGVVIGFTQLYSLYCSLELKHIWVLYDLFISVTERRKGIASHLMKRAESFARETGAAFMLLDTAVDNISAQALYRKQGYRVDTDFVHYKLDL